MEPTQALQEFIKLRYSFIKLKELLDKEPKTYDKLRTSLNNCINQNTPQNWALVLNELQSSTPSKNPEKFIFETVKAGLTDLLKQNDKKKIIALLYDIKDTNSIHYKDNLKKANDWWDNVVKEMNSASRETAPAADTGTEQQLKRKRKYSEDIQDTENFQDLQYAFLKLKEILDKKPSPYPSVSQALNKCIQQNSPQNWSDFLNALQTTQGLQSKTTVERQEKFLFSAVKWGLGELLKNGNNNKILELIDFVKDTHSVRYIENLKQATQWLKTSDQEFKKSIGMKIHSSPIIPITPTNVEDSLIKKDEAVVASYVSLDSQSPDGTESTLDVEMIDANEPVVASFGLHDPNPGGTEHAVEIVDENKKERTLVKIPELDESSLIVEDIDESEILENNNKPGLFHQFKKAPEPKHDPTHPAPIQDPEKSPTKPHKN